ncbi:hypothetical protein [Pseudomonas chlororaphis]|uniref:hypothetical protein n=1 Tax=Pseudomonas chlororaphis TaxID=587753 RepID=UPI001B307B5F|nr:hypothetical protein [Pseudomonas chlororaphis]MBP5055219.1 hypothetical protein [Pseudomonas chlororaphis]MBP5144124.1 hypothetical protein [Pseudomonas chlororaphis]QTU00368.1 hypothetical protein HUT26_14100 [Pseudomonas chlororaphis]
MAWNPQFDKLIVQATRQKCGLGSLKLIRQPQMAKMGALSEAGDVISLKLRIHQREFSEFGNM